MYYIRSIFNFHLNINVVNSHITSIAKQYNWSFVIANNVTIVFIILSEVMFVSAIYASYIAYNHRKLFV